MATIILYPSAAGAALALTTTSLVDLPSTVWNFATSSTATWVADANRTLSVTNLPTGDCFGVVEYVQGAAGGTTPTLPGITATTFVVAQGAGESTMLYFQRVNGVIRWEATPYGVAPDPFEYEGATNPLVDAYVGYLAAQGASLEQFRKESFAATVNAWEEVPGLMEGIKVMWPFCGATAAAQAVSFGNNFNIVQFVGSWIHSNTGALPAGFVPDSSLGQTADSTSAFARTGFVPSANLDVNNMSLSVYLRGTSSKHGDHLSAYQDATHLVRIESDTTPGNHIADMGSSDQRASITTAGSNTTGLFSAVRTSANRLDFYFRGVSLGSSTATQTGSLPTIEFFLAALNFNSSGGTIAAANYSTYEYAYALIGEGRTAAQEKALSDGLDNLMTTWGRNL